MTTLVPLVEYKQNELPGNYGPGDTLRICHALRSPTLAIAQPVILLSGELNRFAGLLPASAAVIKVAGGVGGVGLVDTNHLDNLLAQHLGSAVAGRVLHAFIGIEKPYPWTPRPISTVAGATRWRIDSSRSGRGHMWHGRFSPHCTLSHSGKTLAAFVRRMNSALERNSPDWYFDTVREVAAAQGFNILWCGDASDIAIGSETSFIPERRSFVDQMAYLAAHASCAVEWNSGGLDLAAAAGLPILRVGEFMGKEALLDESESTRTPFMFGEAYNSFLAVATNVGLMPSVIAAKDFPEVVLRDSLANFLRSQAQLGGSRHVILRPGESLAAPGKPLADQLAQREVSWPP